MLRIADLLGSRSHSPARRLRTSAAAFAEALEPRMLLSDTPLPSLADLSNPNNVVVRVETNLGDIDFELFNAGSPGGSAAPNTVANFLNYVRDGDFDLSFLHRLAFIDEDPFVLQGGGFRFDDDAGLSRVPTDDPILNEFDADRSNVERTIAMARIGGQPHSATSQWFINLGDNLQLDGVDGGFTVFGRVLDDRSWDVVQQIVMLSTFVFADVIVDAGGEVAPGPGGQPVPLTGANPVSFALTETPVVIDPAPIPSGTLRSPALEERFLVIVEDAEIIKPADIGLFFANRLAYPEGFRSPNTATTVEIGNLDNNNEAQFQVVVRYENGDRDTVIDFGTVAPGGHATVEIADFELSLDIVRAFVPYAIEVYSTHPVSAALTHTDMGATIGESFVNVTDQEAYGAGGLRRWDFAGLQSIDAEAVQERFPFLVWQNLTLETATITIRIARNGQNDQVFTRELEGLRRGGLELWNIAGYTNGVQSVIVTSDQDLVAALSVYEVRDDGSGASEHAHGALGTVAGPASEGALAGIRIGDGESYISVHNPSKTQIILVDLNFFNSSGVFESVPLTIQRNFRARFDLHNLLDNPALSEGETFTVTYRARIGAPAGPASASVQYVSASEGESVSTPFQTFAAHQSVFSGGGLASDQETEILSIFNPYSASDPDAPTITAVIRFRFVDDSVAIPLQLLGPGERIDIDTSTLTSIMSVIGRSAAHEHYTISVGAFAGVGPDTGPVGAVASLARYDSAGGASMVTLPTLINFFLGGAVDPFIPLDDPIYDGGLGS
jgi:cyclophilin family peptidyl-prolyl cis-trans isomerase